jgi:hypothetical protein
MCVQEFRSCQCFFLTFFDFIFGQISDVSGDQEEVNFQPAAVLMDSAGQKIQRLPGHALGAKEQRLLHP